MTAPIEVRLSALVRVALDLRDRIEAAESDLKLLGHRLQQAVEVDIPAILDEYGLAEATLATGERVTLPTKLFVSISEANQEAAFKWLREHDLGDIIKTITKTAVHPSTLRAQVRELLEAGVDVPQDVFTICQKRIAEIRT